jgi:hypothetical protein
MSFESRMLQVLLVTIHESRTILCGQCQCDMCNYFYVRHHNQLLFVKNWIEVSHFPLKYFFAKVAKETKSPTVGVKFLNASMTMFIIVYRLSDRHLYGTLFADQRSAIVEVFARHVSIVIVVVPRRAVAIIIDFIAHQCVLP